METEWLLATYGRTCRMSDSTDPNKAHGNPDRNVNKPNNEKWMIDGRTLLQVNATAIVGVLFFLSLASLGDMRIFFTLTVLTPFVVSAIWIFISPIGEGLGRAKVLAAIGFVLLMLNILLLMYSQSYPDIFKGFSTEAEKCGRNPSLYNVTHPWECTWFTDESLAGQCAKKPESFGMTKAGCSRFIPPSEE